MMGVLFTTDTPPAVIGWRAECGCGAVSAHGPFTTPEEALLPRYATSCPDDHADLQYAMTVERDPTPEVDLSQGNAIVIFQALGLVSTPPRPGEVEDALNGNALPVDDFLGRVLVALSLAPADPGRPVIREALHGGPPVSGRGGWTDCGRRPGYVQDVLGRLHALAVFARERGVGIALS